MRSLVPPTLVTMLVLAVAVIPSPASAQHHAPDANARTHLREQRAALGVDGWIADAEQMYAAILEIHPDATANVPRTRLDEAFARLRRDLADTDAFGRMAGFARFTAMLGDGHTTIPQFIWPNDTYSVAPIRIGLYEDGAYIDGAVDEFADLLGARVVRFSSLELPTVMERLCTLISRDNDTWPLTIAPELMVRTELMHALGLADSPAHLNLTVNDGAGEREVIVPGRVPEPDATPGFPLFPRRGEPWTDLLLGDVAERPLWLRDPHRTYWSEFLPDASMAYVQLNAIRSAPEGPRLGAFFKATMERVEREGIRYLVVDLRLNFGGNGMLTPRIIEPIAASSVNRPGGLFVIVGRRTFSAGQMLVNDFERSTSATFVGEPTGTAPNSFGDHEPVTLKHSGLEVMISTRWHETAGPDDRRHQTTPHILAAPRFELARQHRDPAFEAILERVRSMASDD